MIPLSRSSLLVLLAALVPLAGLAGPFTAGNLVISRTGDGSTALGNAASQVSLLEVQANGTATGNAVFLPAPVAANGGGLTDSGSASSNGHLQRSTDGRWLVLAGYDAALGTVSVTSTTAAAVNRNIARIDGAGNVSIVARLTDAFSANNVRAAAADVGPGFYLTGNPGVRWADGSAGLPTTSAALTASGSNRTIVVATDAAGNPFLLVSTSTAISAFSGFPTSPATATSLGVTLTDGYAFVLLDRSASVGATGLGGLDTLYVADGSGTGGSATAVLRKFEWNGTAWAAAGTATLSTASSKLFGLTARSAADGSVELFATTAIASNNSLVGITDTSNGKAFGGSLSGTLTVLASAGANYAFRGVACAPPTDLTVSVAAPAAAFTTAPFSYTITATNAGPAKAAGVGVQFTIPSGLSFVSAAGAGFTASQNAGVVTFSGGSIDAGAAASLTVTVMAASAATYTPAAGAAVIDPSGSVEESDEANNASAAATGTVVTDAPDLAVSVAAPATALTGNAFAFTITASNLGLANATGVEVQFTLPAGLTYASATGAGFTIGETNGVVSFTGGSIAAGTSAGLTVNVTANLDGTYTAGASAAVIDPANSIAESVEDNNSSTAASGTVVTTSDLTITNVANGTFVAGDPAATYTLMVSNGGTGATQGTVTVTDILPTGLTATSLAGTGWTIVQGTGGSVSATRSDSLGAGSSYPALTLTVAIELNAAPSLTTHASVAGGGEANTANSFANTQTSIVGAGPGTIAFGPPPGGTVFPVKEETGTVTIPIVRTNGRTGEVTVLATTGNGSATAPEDFTALTGKVITFLDNEVNGSVTVAINPDGKAEPNETLTVTLSSPGDGATLGTSTVATVQILDPDTTAPTLKINTPAANVRVAEGAVSVSGRVSDNTEVKLVEASLNNRPYVPVSVSASAPVAADNFTLALTPQPGANSVTVRATDFRGNTASAVRTFTYVVKRALALAVAPAGQGTVQIAPNEALAALELAKSYTLTATPKAGYVFNGWTTPAGAVEAPALTFTMSAGLAITANFLANPFTPTVSGDYAGLVKATGAVTPGHHTNGFIQITSGALGAFSGTLKIDGQTLTFRGAFDNAGHARFGDARSRSVKLERLNQPSFILALDLDLGSARRITGTVGEDSPGGLVAMSAFTAERAAFDGKTPATSITPTYYTVALPAQPQGNGLTASSYPQGDGIGNIRTTKSGLATLVATLADGAAFSASAPLTSTRTAPLFAELYNKFGSIAGNIAIDETLVDTDVASAGLLWFKPHPGGQHYPLGWPEGVTLPLVGARYVAESGTSVLPDLTKSSEANAVLTFTLGKLASPIEKGVSIGPDNTVARGSTSDLSFDLKIAADTGGISGSFTHSDGMRPLFTGVILQKGANRRAFGYFLSAVPKLMDGAGQSGRVKLITKFDPHPTLVISEFMAKNVTTSVDEDGAHSDWIEIYNPGSTNVDLTDWCLTDDAAKLTKWRFPAVTLGPRAFQLVWASSKNRRAPGQPLHTNFALSASGEYLALVRPDGFTIEQQFAPTFPALADDESYGLNFTGTTLVQSGAAARYKIPTAALGDAWKGRDFSDAAWTSGKVGIGFGVGIPGLTVRQVASGSFGGVSTLARADALLALPTGSAQIASEKTAILAQLNLLGEGADGHFDSNLPPPNGIAEPYALKATGTLNISTAGAYTFGLNSDDGGRIKIDGVAVMTDDTNHGPEDHLGTVTLSAGSHRIEVVMWEQGGGDEVELYAASGTHGSWNDTDFHLVGSPAGLRVTTVPLNSGAASAIVATNIEGAMRNHNATCYVRVPFTASGVSGLNSLTLRMRYNDGFVAYLNGTEIARRNAPAAPAFNSTATATRTDSETLTAEIIDVTAGLPLLVNGRNVLAIQGLNDASGDGSFVILPELDGHGVLGGDRLYFSLTPGGGTATPGTINGNAPFNGRVADTKFSVKRGLFSGPFNLTIGTETPGAQIRYTLDGSTPTATHGNIYSGPLRISKTSIVRSAAFKAGFKPTNVDTQSYFFLDDVIRQSPSGAAPGPGWPSGTVNGQVANYGMDPKIVNSTNPAIGGASKVKQALAAIPTLSLVTDLPNLFDPSTGIWVNSGARGFAWERPCSIELIGDPNTPEGGFQIDGGVRVRGGYSRSGDNPKHGFHLYFRSQYGDSKLNYPLFGNEGANTFAQIDLRTAENYSWSFGGDGNNTFLREETTRELQAAMGQPTSHCRYYHLYINGQYWGLYNTDERTEADFAQTYFGGNKDDYDVVKSEQDSGYTTGVTDGNLDAWQDLWMKSSAHALAPTNANYFAMQGKAADGVSATTDPVLLEVDNLIDYMLLTFWTGNLDGCTSAFLGENAANNWFGIRNRTGRAGFRFFVHDFEHTFFNVDEDRTGPFATVNRTNFDYSNPMFLHHDLRPNAEYRMRWADRVQKHMFTTGALVGANVQTRMAARAALVDRVIMAESARWGDAKTSTPLTRLDWQNARNYLLDFYLPNRGSRVLAQLRADGLYPSFDPPVLSQAGGVIASGSEIVISGGTGTVYYTLDGSDPRRVGGTVNPAAQVYVSSVVNETLVPLNGTWKYLGDGSDQGTAWRAAGFDDSTWASGPAELGYGDGDEATVVPFVDTDPGTGGDQKNATTYFRRTFTASDVTSITTASINLKYDDAAIIYLNGVEAVRTPNIAANAAYNQFASSNAPDESAFFSFQISPALLVEGSNTIAAEIHQVNAESSDISFQLSLAISKNNTPSPLLLTGTGARQLKVRTLSSDEWSALVEGNYEVRNLPDLTLTNLANGTFTAGGTASYTLTIRNQGAASSTGLVTVTDTLPTGLTATGLTGNGWTVVQGTGNTVSATRSDALTTTNSFPPLTLNVALATSAPPSLTNVAVVSGGGDLSSGNNTATVTTPVNTTGPGAISLNAASYAVGEEAGSLPVTIVRTGSTVGSANVRLSTSNGTAKAPGDYDAFDQVIRFDDGDASKQVTINIAADSAKEVNESFTITLSNITGAAVPGSPVTATARILEADSTAPGTALTTPAASASVVAAAAIVSGSASDDKGLARVQVQVNGAAFQDVPITLAANRLSATFATAIQAVRGANTLAVRSYDERGNESATVTRTFNYTPLRPLALTVAPANAGTVNITPNAGLASLSVGATYTLTATPAAGLAFDHWSAPGVSGIAGEFNVLTFTMSEGLAITANFVASPFVPAVTGNFNGLVKAAGSVAASNRANGLIGIDVTSTGRFTGKVKIDAQTLPFSGVFNTAGLARFDTARTATLNLPRPNKTDLVLTLALDLNPAGTQRITGTLGEQQRRGVVPMSTFAADRACYDGKTVATTAAVASFPITISAPPANSAYPTGSGSGTLKVTAQGLVTLTGKLADGTPFTAGAPLSKARTVPIFAPLYAPAGGSFGGLVTFDGAPGNASLLGDPMLWFRPYLTGQTFRFGWPDGLSVQLLRTP